MLSRGHGTRKVGNRCSTQSCICDVKAWATASMLKLNDNKTELMLVTSNRTKHLHNQLTSITIFLYTSITIFLYTSITIRNAQLPFKQSVKNLGFTLDCHLTMNAHVTNTARICYFELIIIIIIIIMVIFKCYFSGEHSPFIKSM